MNGNREKAEGGGGLLVSKPVDGECEAANHSLTSFDQTVGDAPGSSPRTNRPACCVRHIRVAFFVFGFRVAFFLFDGSGPSTTVAQNTSRT